ncbi:proteasome assembly chaperone 1 [Diretmus argenteus]
MATFFGEVLSVYSRAVDEDDDDLDENDEQICAELEEKREVDLQWSPEVSESLRCGSKQLQFSDFIVAVGHNAARFLSVYVLNSANWDTVGHASIWNERTQVGAGQTSKESACLFYQHKDNPSVLLCQVTCYVAEDQLYQWTEKVFGCLQHRGLNVTVLSDSAVAEYKTPGYLSSSSVPILRSLQTSASSCRILCPSLEQPNILTGLPAAVLSHCQVHRIPTAAYQCYSDVISPDSITMETYKPALTRLGKFIKLDPSPSADVLHTFVKASEIQSNLYI